MWSVWSVPPLDQLELHPAGPAPPRTKRRPPHEARQRAAESPMGTTGADTCQDGVRRRAAAASMVGRRAGRSGRMVRARPHVRASAVQQPPRRPAPRRRSRRQGCERRPRNAVLRLHASACTLPLSSASPEHNCGVATAESRWGPAHYRNTATNATVRSYFMAPARVGSLQHTVHERPCRPHKSAHRDTS